MKIGGAPWARNLNSLLRQALLEAQTTNLDSTIRFANRRQFTLQAPPKGDGRTARLANLARE
jgi:hypothetical protein